MAVDLLTPIMFSILNSVTDQLEDNPPGRVILSPGAAVTHDDCCEGQVWVRVQRIEPMVGRTAGTANPCGVLGWVAVLGVGIVRCAAVLDDQGNAPSPEAVTADTVEMNEDSAALAQGILCSGHARTIDQWLPSGPMGGCVGGEWTCTVRYDVCRCEEG